MLNNTCTTNSFNLSSILPKPPCKVVYEYRINQGINYYLPLIITSTIISLVTVISNGIFLFIAYKSRRFQTVHNILLFSLSITDFFTGIVVTPIYPASFVFLMYESTLVLFSGFGRYLSVLSALSLLLLSSDII